MHFNCHVVLFEINEHKKGTAPRLPVLMLWHMKYIPFYELAK